METANIIMSILIYFVLPVIVIFGTMVIIRRKREKDSGRIRSTGDKKIKANEISDIKEEEAKEARHKKANDPSEQTQTGTTEDPETTRDKNKNI